MASIGSERTPLGCHPQTHPAQALHLFPDQHSRKAAALCSSFLQHKNPSFCIASFQATWEMG